VDKKRTEWFSSARTGSVAGSTASASLEASQRLCPIEDRRRLDSSRRLFREGKAALSREVAEILNRPGSSADYWQAVGEAVPRPLLGRFFASRRKRLKELAKQLGLRCVPNLAGCATT
jgi:hypothetical protein